MSRERRPMRRIGDVLGPVAGALGLDEELRLARAMGSWERLVAELAPAAAGSTQLLAIRPPTLVVSADAPIVAQELNLQASALLAAFERAPGGSRLLELRVVVRRPGSFWPAGDRGLPR